MAMGLFQILKEAFTAVPTFDDLNDEFYDGLEEALILADVGADTACDIVEQLRKRVKEKFIGRMEDVKDALRDILRSKLDVGDSALTLRGKPAVVLVIGVNGVGKTTSIGKLAKQLKDQGKKVLLCAGDTFRAAAADQLEIWAGRAGVDIVRQHEGADPGAVLFDSLQAAKARNVDVVFCDTAGRLHNKVGLMNELTKIRNVMGKVIPNAPQEVMLVLDGSTGQNAFEQARQFTQATQVTSLTITKLDGTAKGGVVIGISDQFRIPVRYIGIGEGIDQLKMFDRKEFVNALFGSEAK